MPSNFTTGAARLTAQDYDMFARFGVSAELLEAAGVQRVTDREACVDLGIRYSGDCAGVVFPYRSPVDGHRATCRLRRDHPDVDADGKVAADYTEDPEKLAQQKGIEPGRRVGEGTFALQAHDPGSTVLYRNIRVKRLP